MRVTRSDSSRQKGHNYPGTDWLLSGDQQLNIELLKWMEEFDLRTPVVLT